MALNYKRIGLRIKETRKTICGISQAELAELTELSDSYISHIETGLKKISLELLVRIANALEVTADYLLMGQQPYDRVTYMSETESLLKGCTDFESTVIIRAVSDLKKNLQESLWMLK